MKLSEVEPAERRQFSFLILCIPVKLRAGVIFWIITISDQLSAAFSCFVSIILVGIAPVGSETHTDVVLHHTRCHLLDSLHLPHVLFPGDHQAQATFVYVCVCVPPC